MKLVIFVTTEARQRQIERESPFEMTLEDFKSWTLEDLENYGRSWARMCKDDIVMWVEDEPKELWLVVMVGVYDHGVHYIAESEEEAVQFTKDYAPDIDDYHSWDIRKMDVGHPSSMALKKVGPIWEELEKLNPVMQKVIGTTGYRNLYARRSHLVRHLQDGDIICRCGEKK
jgi:hypothetical protein